MANIYSYEVKVLKRVVVRAETVQEATAMALAHLDNGETRDNGIDINTSGHARVVRPAIVDEVVVRSQW